MERCETGQFEKLAVSGVRSSNILQKSGGRSAMYVSDAFNFFKARSLAKTTGMDPKRPVFFKFMVSFKSIEMMY